MALSQIENKVSTRKTVTVVPHLHPPKTNHNFQNEI